MNKLPSRWELKKIGELGKVITGSTPSTQNKDNYENGIYNFYSPSDLINRKYVDNAEKKLSYKGFLLSKKIPKNSILITGIGDIGRVGITLKESATNQQIHSLIVKENYFVEFIYYELALNKKTLEKHSTKQTIEQLNKNNLENIQIPIPKSLEEQQKIAEILSEVDRSIELTKKIIEKEKRIKKGLMQDLLRYGIDENGNIRNPKTHKFKRSELGLIPKEWEVKKINEVCDILDNYRIPLNEEERQKRKGNIPYYGANGIIDFIDDYIFDDKLILLPEDGGNFENYKIKPIAYKVIGKCWVNNHAHVLKVKSIFDYDYVFYTLEHKDITYYISGGTRTKLNKSDLIKIKTSLPKSLEEQQKIAKVLSLQDEKIEKLNKKLNKLEKIKKALMQDLLTGKVRVTKLLKDKK